MEDEARFYQLLVELQRAPIEARHAGLVRLHTQVLDGYLATLTQITPAGAQRHLPEGWTVAQVVAHITEWERYLITAVGELLAGVQWPRMMDLHGYLEPDGQAHDFASLDAFNAYQSEKYTTPVWEELAAAARATATTLHQLFTTPGLVHTALLERTRVYTKYQLPIGETLALPCGWFLWMITIEHLAVNHTRELLAGSSGSAE